MANRDITHRTNKISAYTIQGEPGQAEKALIWLTAIGLQAVDGLPTTDYLLEISKHHIEGDIDIREAGRLIEAYHQSRNAHTEKDKLSKEGDIVSCRITAALSEKTFTLSPASLIALHRRLFAGVLLHAGGIRTRKLSKQARCLNGDFVQDTSDDEILALLEHTFELEQKAIIRGITLECAVAHFTHFALNLWKIHPFPQGNMRTTAVYLLKFLGYFGLHLTHQPFAEYSQYLCNTPERSNNANVLQGISRTPKFMENFFRNLVLKTELSLNHSVLCAECDRKDGKNLREQYIRPEYLR